MKSDRLLVCVVVMMLLITMFSAAGSVNADADEKPGSTGSGKTFQLLFIGNSHSSANGLPGLVTTMIETGLPGSIADSELASGFGFLSDRLEDGMTNEFLESRSWTHVVLQAQKYSTSGLYYYPTDAAEEWIRRVRAQDAQPILFPEWPRKGNTEEGLRIHELHLSIASREPACVAPVGLAWEESIRSYPSLDLHAPDGNHSNINGATLTAFVFYQLITGQSAARLPHIQSISVSDDIQQKLKQIAAAVVEDNRSACQELAIAPDPRIPTLGYLALLILAIFIMLMGQFALRR